MAGRSSKVFSGSFSSVQEAMNGLSNFILSQGAYIPRPTGDSKKGSIFFYEVGPVAIELDGWNDREKVVEAFTLGAPSKRSMVNLPFCEDEFRDWTQVDANRNPGVAYLHMDQDLALDIILPAYGMFYYTYQERMWYTLRQAIELLGSKNPQSRQAFVSIWEPKDINWAERRRVPCTIGFHFTMVKHSEEGAESYYRMDCTMMMRSVNLFSCLPNDLYLGTRLLEWVAKEVGMVMKGKENVISGRFTMAISNLHLKQSDIMALQQSLLKNMGDMNGKDRTI